MDFLSELKRRNVPRVGAAYLVAAWLLVQVAGTIFPLFGFDETPARIVVIVLAIGLVPTLVLAWVFELTPEGLKREKDVDRSRLVAPRTANRLDRIIMVALALSLGYFAFDKFVLVAAARGGSRAAEIRSSGSGTGGRARRGAGRVTTSRCRSTCARPSARSSALLRIIERFARLRIGKVMAWVFERAPEGLKVDPAAFGNKRVAVMAAGRAP